MKKMRYFLYPALALVLFIMGWSIGGEGFRAYFKGQRVDGHVVGMLRIYEERVDLILDVNQRITLTQADGGAVEAEAQRGGITRVVRRKGEDVREWSAADIQTILEKKDPETEVAQAEQKLMQDLENLATWDKDNVRRYLQRENAQKDDDRFVNIIRRETARMFFDLPDYPDRYDVSENQIGAVSAAGQTFRADDADTVTTTVSFDYIAGTDLAAELKTEVKMEAARSRNGEAVDFPEENFIFYTGNFRYVFRPVVSYEVDGRVFTKATELGGRESPPQNFELYKSVLLSYMGEDPSIAVLSPDFSTLKGRPFLDWLNQLFSVLFGRWYIPLVCWVVATVYVIMSLVLVSLYIWPGKTETADLDEGAE